MDAYQFRGGAKYYLKDYEGAIEDYSKVLEIDQTIVLPKKWEMQNII